MKKEQKKQQFEKIVDANEALGLEMKHLKGGKVYVCILGNNVPGGGTIVRCQGGCVTL